MTELHTIWLLAEAAGAEHEEHGWLFEHFIEAGKELLIGGPWFLLAYLIHAVHHKLWHRPAHWIMRRVFRMRDGH